MINTMDDLVEFLRACIAEDKATAQAATDGPWSVAVDRYDRHPYVTSPNGWVLYGDGEFAASLWLGAEESDLAHIVRWDPARVIAECEAKLLIVEAAQRNLNAPWDAYAIGRDDLGRQVIRALALPYADRPGYRPEWKP